MRSVYSCQKGGLVIVLLIALGFMRGMPCSAAVEAAKASFNIVERGRDFNVWAWQDLNGRKGKVTELATGLNQRSETGEWSPVVESFELFAGGARAKSAAHTLVCNANLNQQSAVTVTLSDGQVFAVTPVALIYEDIATGNTVLLGAIRDSNGEYHAPRTIVYPNTFDGIRADVEYVNSRDSVEQFVVLREAPPHPNQWGGQLDPETTVIQCWSEVFDRPAGSQVRERVLPDGQVDQSVSFPEFQIGAGRAFPMGTETERDLGAPVAKRWFAADGRLFLIESVLYTKVEKSLGALPGMNQAALPGLQKRGALPPQVQQAKVDRKGVMQLAAAPRMAPGLVLDWSAITASVSNWTFRAGETYAVSGSVNLDGETTFEGTEVIKLTNNASLNLRGSVVCKSGPYRPVVITSWHDDRVGTVLPGSTGDPTNRMGSPALKLDAYTAADAFTLEYFRICHAKEGVQFYNGGNHILRHFQFLDCTEPLQFYYASAVIRNALIVDSGNAFGGSGYCTARVEHVTVDNASFLVSTNWLLGQRVYLTNCVLANVGSMGAGYSTNSSSSVTLTDSTGFLPVGSAGHYLAASLADSGTTNVNATLAGELRRKTTVGPVVVLSGDWNGPLLLAPATPRDADPPDPGYHYDVIDIAVNNLLPTNGAVSIAPGTVVAAFGKLMNDCGLALPPGSGLTAEGRPDQPIWLVSAQTVQEPARTNWNCPLDQLLYGPYENVAPIPSFRTRFVNWTTLGDQTVLLYAPGTASSGFTTVLRDNQFHGGRCEIDSANLAWTNNLFNGCATALSDIAAFFDGTNVNVTLRNNTWIGAQLSLDQITGGGTWSAYDNLFGCTNLVQNYTTLSHDYNAYRTNLTRLTPAGVHDVTNLTLNLKSGPLGWFYHATNSPLVNAGSTAATNLGLYHFTVSTNLVREGVTTVDIGFHFVVTDANGVPVDTDGDGWPDWLEDENGNGVIDGREGNPSDVADTGFRVYLTRPRVGSHIP